MSSTTTLHSHTLRVTNVTSASPQREETTNPKQGAPMLTFITIMLSRYILISG